MLELYDCKNKWYKGNLHSHSTISDGVLSPIEVIDFYKSEGYHFLALSEHEIFTDFREYNDQEFIILPAIEYSSNHYDKSNGKRIQTHHVHGILGDTLQQKNASNSVMKHMESLSSYDWNGQKTAQIMIDDLISRGNICIYNHPTWSRIEYDEISALKDCFAIEVYNHCSELESHTGYSVQQWDSLLRKGVRINAVATDDNHNVLDDSFGGWVSVNAESLEHDAIIAALQSGRYYSSNGPSINRICVDGDEVYVECSPVNRIHFIASDYLNSGFSEWGTPGSNTLIGAKFKRKGDEKYLRVECVDCFGNTAWSNPIYFD